MIPFRRQMGACATLGLIIALSCAVAEASLEARKSAAIDRIVASGVTEQDTARFRQVAQQANDLSAIRALEKNALRIELSKSPSLETTGAYGGQKIVLDFGDTMLLVDKLESSAALPDIMSDVRFSQYSVEPLTARVVIDFRRPVHYETTTRDGHTVLLITPRDGAATAVAEIVISSPEGEMLAEVAGLEAQLANLRMETEAPAAPAAPRKETDSLIAAMAADLERLRAEASDAAMTREVERLAFELQAVSAPRIELFRSVTAINAAQDEESLLEPPLEADTAEDPLPATESDVEGGDVAADDMAEDDMAEDDMAEDGADTDTEAAEDAAPEDAPLLGEEGFEFDEETATPPGPRIPPSQQTVEANEAITSRRIAFDTVDAGTSVMPAAAADAPAPTAPKAYSGDPLERRVNLDFRQMDLANVVALLGHMAGINIIAGTDLTGTVTANFKDVPLRQAMQTVLRINGLGMVEEENIYRIVPYEEAMAASRVSTMVTLNNAKAREVGQVLSQVMRGSSDQRLFNIAADESANIVIISGPADRVDELVQMAHQLDVAEPKLPTITEPIKLNYAEPSDVIETITKMLTPQIGNVGADERSRHIVVTDVPVVVEQIRTLVAQIDLPVKQVAIDSMVVDVSLQDEASTGVDWLLDAVRRQSRRAAALGGPAVGNLQELGLGTNLGIDPASAGLLSFNVLSDNFDWRGIIQAEVRNFNGELVSNPVLVTVENKPAKIEIVREIPFVELTQTNQGGSQTSTEFKIVGTVLEVTPRVTHDNNIIADLLVKESDTSGEFNGVPIEDKRELETTLRLGNGQTIFTGGLRKNGKGTTVRKVPVLGDVPVVNLLFRSTVKDDRVNELLIFMTCRVVEPEEGLTPHLQNKVDGGRDFELKTDAFNEIVHETIHPAKFQDPVWKFRRAD